MARTTPRAALLALAACLATLLSAPAGPARAEDGAAAADATELYLVVFDDPRVPTQPDPTLRALLTALAQRRQQTVLAEVGGPEVVYRYTRALNGVAVRLDDAQARALALDPAVRAVERNRVLPLAGVRAGAGTAVAAPARGGAGVVVGLIDTGIAPESPSFAALGRPARPERTERCTTGEQWTAADCGDAVAAARWFVAGFGADALAARAVLSPRDTDGHGSVVAALVAGNPGVKVAGAGPRAARTGGQAPDARLGVYKACWNAPDPADDGCATADVVAAIEAAIGDGVDVLHLPTGDADPLSRRGDAADPAPLPGGADVVDLALLGATEEGVLAVAAAGAAPAAPAHPVPWVLSVGALEGDQPRGVVRLRGAPRGAEVRLAGAMLSGRAVTDRRVVRGADVAATGVSRTRARSCEPGSLDAAAVSGAVVVCLRGRVARVDKSAAVARADGAGMILLNTGRAAVDADPHAVPTVHLTGGAGRRLLRWLAERPRGRVDLLPTGVRRAPPRVGPTSPRGATGSGLIKPDLVAPGTGLVGAVPGSDPAAFLSGTSAASALVAGTAARLLTRPGWSVPVVRAALATGTRPLAGRTDVRAAGGGRLGTFPRRRPGLTAVVAPERYRTWWQGEQPLLNTPGVLLPRTGGTARRVLTHLGEGTVTYVVTPPAGSGLVVTPAVLRLRPGARGVVRIARADDAAGPAVRGVVLTWRGDDGSRSRLPVLLTP
ncbi:S8 family serine peptidase [Nocardioides sp.]|uniref:S8 family serine peptidase n=1 Tax=Nocardioides sp. TaxID=35761 RepID=UPI003518CEB5